MAKHQLPRIILLAVPFAFFLPFAGKWLVNSGLFADDLERTVKHYVSPSTTDCGYVITGVSSGGDYDQKDANIASTNCALKALANGQEFMIRYEHQDKAFAIHCKVVLMTAPDKFHVFTSTHSKNNGMSAIKHQIYNSCKAINKHGQVVIDCSS